MGPINEAHKLNHRRRKRLRQCFRCLRKGSDSASSGGQVKQCSFCMLYWHEGCATAERPLKEYFNTFLSVDAQQSISELPKQIVDCWRCDTSPSSSSVPSRIGEGRDRASSRPGGHGVHGNIVTCNMLS